jgi:hypothetical protein
VTLVHSSITGVRCKANRSVGVSQEALSPRQAFISPEPTGYLKVLPKPQKGLYQSSVASYCVSMNLTRKGNPEQVQTGVSTTGLQRLPVEQRNG